MLLNIFVSSSMHHLLATLQGQGTLGLACNSPPMALLASRHLPGAHRSLTSVPNSPPWQTFSLGKLQRSSRQLPKQLPPAWVTGPQLLAQLLVNISSLIMPDHCRQAHFNAFIQARCLQRLLGVRTQVCLARCSFDPVLSPDLGRLLQICCAFCHQSIWAM